MTEADIPLRAEIAQVIAKRLCDHYGVPVVVQDKDRIVADAVLAAFDISPRGSLPVNEEPE